MSWGAGGIIDLNPLVREITGVGGIAGVCLRSHGGNIDTGSISVYRVCWIWEKGKL